MAREHTDAVIIFADPFLLSQRTQIAGLALKYRLPSIYPQSQYAEAGGLMTYGADVTDNFRRAANFVDINRPISGFIPSKVGGLRFDGGGRVAVGA
jgi:ABC-type uncharacterized transport system substrate-binding protein